MTTLLQQAFEAAARLPEAEQDCLAYRLLAEIAVEDGFDQKLAETGSTLSELARAALAEHRAKRTEPLPPDSLSPDTSGQDPS